jgi:hypothetical protein
VHHKVENESLPKSRRCPNLNFNFFGIHFWPYALSMLGKEAAVRTPVYPLTYAPKAIGKLHAFKWVILWASVLTK